MLDQTLLPERIFGLSVVDGRRTVRPGAVVRFRFRARNASEIATPTARLTFAVPFGWSALDALDVEIPAIRPGGEHVVWFAARPDLADESTAASRFQAVLHLDDAALGSNVVTVRVTGNARFSPPASAVRIEPAAGARLRVAVDLINEGDAAARDVRVIVPPPPGFRAAPETTVATTPELKPGASFAFAYEMEPFAPASPIVRIDDAFVTFQTGRVALMTGATYLLAPNLLPPEIRSTRAATRLDSTIEIANDGWVPARDVRVMVELPAGWRILRGTMLADGAPAAIRRDPGAENGVTLALPFVPARGSVAVSVVSSASRPRTDGSILVRCGDHTIEAPIPDPAKRALRLEARPESPFAIPGAAIPVAIDVFNNGETLEHLTIALDGASTWDGEIKPGSSVAIVARYLTPDSMADGDVASVSVTALAADDALLGAVAIDLRVVDRPWIAIEEVAVEGGEARVIVRNVGATTARGVRLDGDTDVRIDALAPGETQAIALAVGQARHGAVVAADGASVPIGWDVQPEAVAVEAELLVAGAVRAGQRLDIRLRCVAAAALETLRVRPRPHSGAVYVAGSTSVNGYAIVDGIDGPPLLLGDGLSLYDIPAGTTAEVAWSLLPRTPGDLILSVDVTANGAPIDLADARVRISDAMPFGARPNALPFHIDAATVADPTAVPVPPDPPVHRAVPNSVAPPLDAVAPPPVDLAPPVDAVAPPPGADALVAVAASVEAPPQVAVVSPVAVAPVAVAPPAAISAPAAGTFVALLTLDDARLAAIRRVLRGARGPGLVGHLPAIAVLLPTAIGADPTVSGALSQAVDAVRGVYERLFVKLRIPGYDVTPFDFEDNAARRSLLHFFRTAAGGAALPPYGNADLRVTLTSSALAATHTALAEAPLGGSVTLSAIGTLLPRGGDGPIGAIGSYVERLASELAETRVLAHDAFTGYVTAHRSPSLDAARDAAVAALDAPGLVAGS